MAIEDGWHFDKTINVSVAIGFVVATSTGIWYASAANARLDILERQNAILIQLPERIIRIEGKMDALHESVISAGGPLREAIAAISAEMASTRSLSAARGQELIELRAAQRRLEDDALRLRDRQDRVEALRAPLNQRK